MPDDKKVRKVRKVKKVSPAQKAARDRMKRAAKEYKAGNYPSMQVAMKHVR